MKKEISILILIICAFADRTVVAQTEVYGRKFGIVGETFLEDDGIKRTEVIFVDRSKCIIKQKYYDPEISKDYSVEAEYNYKKEWTYNEYTIEGKRIYVYYYKTILYPLKGNVESDEPYIKLSDYAIQRLNFSFGSPYRNDYYPDGERKECIFRMEDPWDYTPVQERDGYLINPSSIQILEILRIPFNYGWKYSALSFKDAPFKNHSVVSMDYWKHKHFMQYRKQKLSGKTFVILDPYRMERFAFINNNTCIYSQFIPMRGDTIEVRQTCKYKQDGCFVSLTPYSCTLTDSLICAMQNNEDVCVGCGKEGVRCFPASYVHFVNVIESDTLVIKKGVLFYSKVFHFPDHNPIHFYRAYYPMNGDILRLDRHPYNFISTPYKCLINFGNARVPIDK